MKIYVVTDGAEIYACTDPDSAWQMFNRICVRDRAEEDYVEYMAHEFRRDGKTFLDGRTSIQETFLMDFSD